MISAAELDAVLVDALPELASDHPAWLQKRRDDPEFVLSFFSYSFVPTLQAAMDREIEPFCQRAFALVEKFLLEGDPDVLLLLRDEFFEYGPVCEKWMSKGIRYMGPRTLALARAQDAESTA